MMAKDRKVFKEQVKVFLGISEVRVEDCSSKFKFDFYSNLISEWQFKCKLKKKDEMENIRLDPGDEFEH